MSVTDSAAEKVARGRAHIAELTREIDVFLATEPYATEHHVEQGGRLHTFTVCRDTPAPTSIGLLIGDAAHNLRSALDHVAVACAARGAGRELTEEEERRIEFPICRYEKAFENARAAHKLDFVEPTPLEIIRRCQPYMHAPPTPEHPQLPEWTLQWRLSVLDNMDKHRRVHTTSYVVTVPLDGSTLVSEGPAPRVEYRQEGWGVGSIVAAFIFDDPLPHAPITWKPQFSITIENDGPSLKRPDKTLEDCATWVDTFVLNQMVKWEFGLLSIERRQ